MKNFVKSIWGKTVMIILENLLFLAGAVCSVFSYFGLNGNGIFLYHIGSEMHHVYIRGMLPQLLAGAAAALILVIFLFILLMNAAGKRPHMENCAGLSFYLVPYDLLLAASTVLFFLAANLISELLSWSATLCIVVPLMMNLLLFLFMELAGRVRNHVLVKRTLIYHIFRLIQKAVLWVIRGFRLVPFAWRTAIVIFAALLVGLLAIFTGGHIRNRTLEMIFWLLCLVVAVPAVLYFSFHLQRLQQGAEKLAEGDLTHRVDSRGMVFDLKKHADCLNRISEGMHLAVEEQLKSERMKTEMITNVSHDLKTPLTSIVNYAELISGEETENENIKEYSEVLVRQSAKLKRLLEDLLEFSKANTGNLEVDCVPCEAAVFLSQLSGEYEERLSACALTPVLSLPEEAVMIRADGRRMWRVFDNIMNNICKYALPGTRVYLSLIEEKENAVFEFKNISKAALNISADELMERFVRGDASRNTEGNGLGLSIAESFVNLQGGTLNVAIDGDLFKVTIRMPKC